MLGHIRRTRRHPFLSLSLEPLEDRLLLSGLTWPTHANASGPNPSTPASTAPGSSTAAAPDSAATSSGYVPDQNDTTPGPGQIIGPLPAATASGNATPGAAGSPNTASPAASGTGAAQNEYAPSAAQQTNAANYHQSSYYDNGDTPNETYSSEYYAPSSPAAAKAVAPTNSPAVSAVLGSTSSTAVSNTQPTVNNPGPASPALPPIPVVTIASSAGPVVVPMPPQADVVARRASAAGAPAWLTLPEVEESAALIVPGLETGRVFPLALPLPGGLLPLDLAAWERGVRSFFSRLDALAEDAVEDANWERLAPWCAVLGILTVSLELVRHRLSKRYPLGLTQISSRGLAWRWPRGSESDHFPEGS